MRKHDLHVDILVLFTILPWNIISTISDFEKDDESSEDQEKMIHSKPIMSNIQISEFMSSTFSISESLLEAGNDPRQVTLKKGNNTYFYLLSAETANLTFMVIPSCTNITWAIYFRGYQLIQPLGLLELKDDVEIYRYSGSEINAYYVKSNENGLCSAGLYKLVVIPSSANDHVHIHVSHDAKENHIFNVFKRRFERRIRIKKNFHTNVTKIEWPTYEPFAFYLWYFVIVDKKRFYNTYCAIVQANRNSDFLFEYPQEGDIQFSMQDRDQLMLSVQYRTQIVLPVQQHETYYVSVFANHYMSSPLFLYAQAKFEFEKFKTCPLKDGQLVNANLTLNGGKLSYKYKVKESENSTMLYFLVIPCNGTIDVEIRIAKKIIINQTISSYKKFDIPNPLKKQRYVLKIIDESRGLYPDSEIVQVLATTRTNRLVPDHCPNSKIKLTSVTTCSEKGKIGVLITWDAIITNETLTYCIRTNRISANFKYRNCGITEIKNCKPLVLTNLVLSCRNTECFEQEPTWKHNISVAPTIKHDVFVTANQNHKVQVFVRKPGSMNFINYGTTRIKPQKACENNLSPLFSH